MNAMSIDIEQITAREHSGNLARLQLPLITPFLWSYGGTAIDPLKYANVQINYNTEA